ncbi:hypothetical protein BKA70DRAFT_835392 [Coprinopsis sp. MPI-PUGE-AT-0042]|nr:hypothetical protein BKA70DRAFT_835392 [Coprinopsis sp. MPI-PUGE-AT-0042]
MGEAGGSDRTFAIKGIVLLVLLFTVPTMAIKDHSTLDDTYGAAMIGVLVNVMLYGATTSQTYTYYTSYPKDNRRNTFMVGALWILDTVQTFLSGEAMYFYLISNYGRPHTLERAHWSIHICILLNRLIAFIAQIYFSYVTFKLCPQRFRKWLVSTISILVFANVGFGVAFVILCYVWGSDYGRIREMNKYGAVPSVVAGVIAEFLIAGCLCIFLKERASDFKGTRKVIRQVLFYAINRCLLSSIFLTVEVALMETKSATFYYMALEFIVGKLYVASVLATLNARPVETPAPRISFIRATVHAVDYASRQTGATETNGCHLTTPIDDSPYILKEVPLPFDPAPLRRILPSTTHDC